MYHVEKAAIDILSHKDRIMIALWPDPLLIVPVFYCPNNMRFIRFAQHQLHFIHCVVLRIFQKQIEASTRRLWSLLRYYLKVAEAQAGRVRADLVLQPGLVEASLPNRN